ncbi:MAG: hypothetical protein ACXVHS_04550 [Methanobacterium sp.]
MTKDDNPVYTAEITPETKPPEGMEFQDLGSLYEVQDEDIYLLAGRTIQVKQFN